MHLTQGTSELNPTKKTFHNQITNAEPSCSLAGPSQRRSLGSDRLLHDLKVFGATQGEHSGRSIIINIYLVDHKPNTETRGIGEVSAGRRVALHGRAGDRRRRKVWERQNEKAWKDDYGNCRVIFCSLFVIFFIFLSISSFVAVEY